jgi:hypothetical protein
MEPPGDIYPIVLLTWRVRLINPLVLRDPRLNLVECAGDEQLRPIGLFARQPVSVWVNAQLDQRA